jgi:hypothetical protein
MRIATMVHGKVALVSTGTEFRFWWLKFEVSGADRSHPLLRGYTHVFVYRPEIMPAVGLQIMVPDQVKVAF